MCLKGSSVLGGPFFMDLFNRFFNLKKKTMSKILKEVEAANQNMQPVLEKKEICQCPREESLRY
jgi:hypothetical protein